jgi:hypothetical protein
MLHSTPSSATRLSLIYITGGTLIVIWTGVWYVYLHNNPPVSHTPFYWCGGLAVTGLAFLGIGLCLGQIGRAARHAEIPPEAVITTPVVTDAHGQPVGTAAVALPPQGATAPVVPPPAAAAPVATVPMGSNNAVKQQSIPARG